MGNHKLPVPYEREIMFDSGDLSFVGGHHELRTVIQVDPFGTDGDALRAVGNARMLF